MSARRANGMAARTGLGRCGSAGGWLRSGGRPTYPSEPYPLPKPPPGSPIWPSIAASVTTIHGACSPCSTRWSDQFALMRVRFAAIRRASVRIVSAGIPESRAAHSGDFVQPSSAPRR